MMTIERKIEVLETFVEELAKERGVRIVSQSEFKRSLGNFAKSTKVPETELREIIEPIIRRLVDKMLTR